MLDFFQIVSIDTLRAGNVHHAGVLFVIIEIIFALAVVVVASVAVAVLPAISAHGGVSHFLKSRDAGGARRQQSTTSSVAKEKQSHPPAAPVHAPVVPAPSKVHQETVAVVSPTDASELEASCPPTPSPPSANGAIHNEYPPQQTPSVDLDAVFDEFCDEESLMDEAFVNSVITPGDSVRPQTAQLAASAPNRHEAPAQSAKPVSREETDLAKKMMRGFASPVEPKPKVAVAKVAPPSAAPSTSAAEKTPKFEAAAAPKPSAQPKSTALAAVDLDAVFDELETTEEALSDALLDTLVSGAK